jgi:electron transfer flavoprotein beta subunit
LQITVDGNNVKAVREIDGGKETVSTSLPLIIGDKRIGEEKGLAYEENYDRKNKTLTVLEPVDAANDKAIKFEKTQHQISSELIPPII